MLYLGWRCPPSQRSSEASYFKPQAKVARVAERALEHNDEGVRGEVDSVSTLRSLAHNVKFRAKRYYLRRRNSQAADLQELWATALADELAYWRMWLATGGAHCPADYQFRLDPEAELQESITSQLDRIGARVRLLDVGAGPLTSVGKRWSGHDFSLTAVDALADEYDLLLDEFAVVPPVRTRRCDTEHLAKAFVRASFDVAYASNTLDHSYAPMEAIHQMVDIVRPGGIVLLHHRTNEAERQAYTGLHQWNFEWVDNDCHLWRPSKTWRLRDELVNQATVTGAKAHGDVTVVITKNS